MEANNLLFKRGAFSAVRGVRCRFAGMQANAMESGQRLDMKDDTQQIQTNVTFEGPEGLEQTIKLKHCTEQGTHQIDD